MTVYYSILIFTCFFAWFGCFIKRQSLVGIQELDDNLKMQKSISLFFALLSVSLLVFFAGMRTNYIDTKSYIYTFNELSIDYSMLKEARIENSDRIGWIFIQFVFKKFISQDANAFLTFIAIIQIGAIVKIFYKYSTSYLFSIFLYITSCSFLYMFNGIRQFTAACIILYFFECVPKRKFIKFLIVVLIAYTVHSSAIVWIPIYFICIGKPWSPKILLFIVGLILILMSINQFTNFLSDSLEDTSYAGYTDAFADDDGVHPLKVIIAAIPPLIAFIQRKRIEEHKNYFYDMLINIATANAGIYLLGVFTSGILIGRIPIYFQLTNYILLPWLLKFAFDDKIGKAIKWISVILYFAYFYYIMVVGGSGFYVSDVLGIKDIKYF